jgi:hypothetical protein
MSGIPAAIGSEAVILVVAALGFLVALDRGGVAGGAAGLISRVPRFMARGASGWGTGRPAIRLNGLCLGLIGLAVALIPTRVGALTVVPFSAFVLLSIATMIGNYWNNRPGEGHFRIFRGKVRGWELGLWILVWVIGAALYVLQAQAFHTLR